MAKTAFDGVKVLEYAQFVSGPYCTKLLGDLGAEVIKIEPPTIGDEARRREPFLDDIPHPERSGLFLYLNCNKMGITLDPKTATGREIFKKLVKESDVLVEDNPPQVMKELGLDYERLKDINPRLIMASITPFGQTGPYRDYKAYHLNSYSGSGLAQILAGVLPEEIKMPLKGGGMLGEYDCGLSAAVAIVGALYSRLFTNEGQYIDISKQESLIAMERVEIGMCANSAGASTVYMGGMVGGLQRCKDGYVVITIPMDHQWQAMKKLMGEPEWAYEEKYNDELSRAKHADEANKLIGEWTINHAKDEIYHQAQELSCPLGMISTVEDMLGSEQLQARGFFVDVEHPEMGKVKLPAAPYRFSETPWRVERPAHLLGEHNEEVYSRRLGYAKEELVRMRGAGII
jgi:crotonobetainyl-CoA:carnitine CoA-transferase CaiB-like acyl-CoA transferase